jgi:bifunctional UDP-N-acetylglucosamine pyrophosphorylase/glucosamine-1-phosphate N-acetyltransferase
MSEKVAVVMAAGRGTRMKSDLPKVLMPVCGRPMIDYVLDALVAGGMDRIIVVVGYRSEAVKAALAGRDGIEFALQNEQLGTGHAVMMCREFLTDHDGPVMVIAGDSPMTQSHTVTKLLDKYKGRQTSCILGTIESDNPTGMGRIVRDEAGEFQAIVEEKDATDEQRRISEVNMSYYVFDCRDLLQALGALRDDNAQGEYYITDVPGLLKVAGKSVQALPVLEACEAMGVNTPEDLAAVEMQMSTREPDSLTL